MTYYLSIEIQEEIINRLPVKSLLQLRSVSKAWKVFIDSPNFIAAYSLRQTQTHHILIRYRRIVETDERYVCFVDDDYFPKKSSTPTVPLFSQGFRVIGSSGGLLCIHGDYIRPQGMIVLGNPYIRKSVPIDVSDLSYGIVLGFGVSPITNDPTIVKITHQTEANITPTKVEVYTLSSKISIIDGFRTSYMIMSFDMTTHELREVYLPNSLAHLSDLQVAMLKTGVTISKVRESLAVLEYSMETEKRICAVWIKYGASKSFSKLFTIKTPYASMKILGFKMNGEPIIEYLDEFNPDYSWVALVVHEPNAEHNLGIFTLCGSLSMSSYEESLLLLNQ